MSGIIVRIPRTRQPQGAATYSLGLSAPPLPGIVGGRSTHGLAVTHVGSPTLTPGPAGIALEYPPGSTALSRAPIPGSTLGTTLRGASMLMVFSTTENAGAKFLGGLGSDQGGTGTTIFQFVTGGSAALSVYFGGSYQYGPAEIAGTVVNDGRVHTAVLSVSLFDFTIPSKYHVALDGRLVSAEANSWVSGNWDTYNWVVQGGFRRGGSDAPSAACKIYAVIPFDGYLKPAEAVALSANPWSVFAPTTRRIWVPGAGGSLPTLTAATYVPGSLTSNGFRPRVTAS